MTKTTRTFKFDTNDFYEDWELDNLYIRLNSSDMRYTEERKDNIVIITVYKNSYLLMNDYNPYEII